MNYYEKEINILNELFDLQPQEILLQPEDNENAVEDCEKILLSLIDKEEFSKTWHDNTKSNYPPDFINDRDNLMMEIMRVDDHSKDGKTNPLRTLENDFYKKLTSLAQNDDYSDFISRINLMLSTDLPTNEDHNYGFYLSSFERTLKKHKSKIDSYKKHYPNKKLIFFIFDETSGVYAQTFDGLTVLSKHLHCFDKNIIDKFLTCGADYVIWYTPYNYAKFLPFKLPTLTIFDIKNFKYEKHHSKFDINKVFSSER